MDEFRISKATGTWVVRIEGSVIGESRAALQLDEPWADPVIYFPHKAVAMALLERSAKTSTHPGKGTAGYFDFVSPDVTLADVAWSFENPPDTAVRIANHIAFDAERVTVEQL